MQSCTWIIAGMIDPPSGSYILRTAVADDFGGVSLADSVITVVPEDALVSFDDDNPPAVPVAASGGSSEPFELAVHVVEKEPDLAADPAGSGAPGDIGRADVTMTLVPIGPGSAVSPSSCSESLVPAGYAGELTVVCDFNAVPVNTYTLQVVVDGGYYAGSGEDVLVVFDTSLGFTTGGGWFYWPGTTDKTNFGYTMKYNKKGKSQRIKGNLLLIRHLADGTIYRVKSNALNGLALGDAGGFTWASFSGKATYQEPGWPDAIGNHKFLVYVEDHGEPGTASDRFWIEVLDRDGNPTSLSMAREAIDNTVVLGGGNIVVPH